jgi:O-methyltransferase
MRPPALDERRRAATEHLFRPRQPRAIVADKDALYDVAADAIGRNAPVTVLEFGVFGGHTLRQLAARFISPRAHFTGFDSFEGIPDEWHGFERGAFSTEGAMPRTDDERVEFVKGWFQNTVSDWIAEARIPAPVLVHFDADLYGSTLFLLTTLWHRIPEYHFLMDDFVQEDLVALHDFSSAYPVEIEFIASVGTGERLHPPAQALGRCRKVPFVLQDRSPAAST